MVTVGVTACSSNPYSQPKNLKFQNSSHGKSQNLTIIRDDKLCSNDQSDNQNCPVKLYIDDIKAGDFFINNSAKYSLNSEVYNLKAKNCTDKCFVCETDLDASVVKENLLYLSVDSQGHPLILDADQKLMCKTPSDQKVDQILPEVKTIQLNLAADTLFKFDGSSTQDLLPKGYQEILNVTKQVKENFVSIDHIHLTGHTDRLGTESYNNNLALNRAKTVRDVFIQNGISKNIISTMGKGESMPVTDGCYGVKDATQLKECLQPDRRVTVEIAGISKDSSEIK